MNIIIRLTVVLFVLFMQNQGLAHQRPPIKLHVGDLKIVPSKTITRIVVGNGDIVSTKVIDGNKVLLIGEQVGQSDVQFWNERGKYAAYTVIVSERAKDSNIAYTLNILEGLPGVVATTIGDQIVLKGTVDEKTMSQVERIIAKSPQIISLLERKEVEQRDMIRMDVKIVEFSKKALNNIGVDWGDVASGPAYGAVSNFSHNDLFSVNSGGDFSDAISGAIEGVAIGSTSYSHFGIVTGIASQVNLMVQDGEARFLAEPTISTRSGEKATFFSGGEIPIPVTGGDGDITVIFKEYGIKLEIQPTSDADGNIVSLVKTEVSSIDPAVTVQGFPGFLTRESESVIGVKAGSTMVISGLVSSDMSKTISKFPFLGDIPILGELFKSRDFSDKKTELVILVTPHIVPVEGKKHQQQLKRAYEMIEQAKDLKAFYILD